MNDYLSPLLVLFEDEVDTFWVFASMMEYLEGNFHWENSTIHQQLAHVGMF